MNNNDGIEIDVPMCPRCKQPGKVILTEIQLEEFKKWNETGQQSLIQEGLSTWPHPLREQLMTGIDPECWKQIFETDEDGDFIL